MSRKLIYVSFPILLLVGIYFLGSEPVRPTWDKTLPVVPQEPGALEKYISMNEGRHKLKPDNEARIVWADSSKKKTPYSVVYLHGFSASQKEGDPVHLQFAKEFGCNLYLARLSDHGIDTTEQLLYFNVDRYWATAKQALSIGMAIGDKVILLSTSTGGTIALVLAAEYPEDVFALINMSPNVQLANPKAWLLNNPWGLQIARKILGSDYYEFQLDGARQPYWNSKYRIEALTQVQELIEDKMNKETFARVKQPSLTLYYFKNELEQDPEVMVSREIEMNKELGTPDSLKAAIPVPNAGAHVIGCYLVSKDLTTVENEVEKFALEKLHLKKIN